MVAFVANVAAAVALDTLEALTNSHTVQKHAYLRRDGSRLGERTSMIFDSSMRIEQVAISHAMERRLVTA